MASRGKSETEGLLTNIREQLNRLVAQLEDLEELKEELDDEEYAETKQETIDQMKEFETFIEKAMAGHITLVDELGSIQLAIQAAVSNAFKTPEVIKLFAKREPGQLRTRLTNLQTSYKLGKVTEDTYAGQAIEIMVALKKLGEPLSAEEEAFMSRNMNESLSEFEKFKEGSLVGGTKDVVLKVASHHIKSAKDS